MQYIWKFQKSDYQIKYKEFAFEGVRSINQLVIPSSVTEIGDYSLNTAKPIPIFIYQSHCLLTANAFVNLDSNSKVIINSNSHPISNRKFCSIRLFSIEKLSLKNFKKLTFILNFMYEGGRKWL